MAIAKKVTSKPVVEAAKPAVVAPAAKPAVVAPAAKPATAAAPAIDDSLLRDAAEKALANARQAQEQFRKASEQSMMQSRAAYEKLRTMTENASVTMESSYAAASKGVSALNAKTFDALKSQSNATLEHMQAVMTAKSFGEVIALQSAHARKQFESLAAQAKEFTALAQSVVAEAGAPLQESIKKGFAA